MRSGLPIRSSCWRSAAELLQQAAALNDSLRAVHTMLRRLVPTTGGSTCWILDRPTSALQVEYTGLRGHIQAASLVDGQTICAAPHAGFGLRDSFERPELASIPNGPVGLNVEGDHRRPKRIRHVQYALVGAQNDAVRTRDVVGNLDDRARRALCSRRPLCVAASVQVVDSVRDR